MIFQKPTSKDQGKEEMETFSLKHRVRVAVAEHVVASATRVQQGPDPIRLHRVEIV